MAHSMLIAPSSRMALDVLSRSMRSPLVDHETYVRLVRSRDFLAAHLDRRLKLEDGARVACLSPYHYQRTFLRAFGESPHAFVTRLRLARAKELLANDTHSVTDVCFSVGYSSLGTFSSTFAQALGCSPSEYRRTVRRVFPAGVVVPIGFVPTCLLRWWRTAVWPTAAAEGAADSPVPQNRKIEEAFSPPRMSL